MAKKFEIRNSTAEFLTFVAEGKEQGIQVLYKEEIIPKNQTEQSINNQNSEEMAKKRMAKKAAKKAEMKAVEAQKEVTNRAKKIWWRLTFYRQNI